jgi:hypothetical protein
MLGRITMQGIELQCQVELQHHPSNYNVGAELQWLWDTAIKFRSPAIPFVNVILSIITSGYNRPTNPGDGSTAWPSREYRCLWTRALEMTVVIAVQTGETVEIY